MAGNVTDHIFWNLDAPSIKAASYISCGTEVIAARYIMELNPKLFQIDDVMITTINDIVLLKNPYGLFNTPSEINNGFIVPLSEKKTIRKLATKAHDRKCGK
jgi:hypothetical protein